MEKKIKISIQFICLITVSFLLGCGVKGDPQEPLIGTSHSKIKKLLIPKINIIKTKNYV